MASSGRRETILIFITYRAADRAFLYPLVSCSVMLALNSKRFTIPSHVD